MYFKRWPIPQTHYSVGSWLSLVERPDTNREGRRFKSCRADQRKRRKKTRDTRASFVNVPRFNLQGSFCTWRYPHATHLKLPQKGRQTERRLPSFWRSQRGIQLCEGKAILPPHPPLGILPQSTRQEPAPRWQKQILLFSAFATRSFFCLLMMLWWKMPVYLSYE